MNHEHAGRDLDLRPGLPEPPREEGLRHVAEALPVRQERREAEGNADRGPGGAVRENDGRLQRGPDPVGGGGLRIRLHPGRPPSDRRDAEPGAPVYR